MTSLLLNYSMALISTDMTLGYEHWLFMSDFRSHLDSDLCLRDLLFIVCWTGLYARAAFVPADPVLFGIAIFEDMKLRCGNCDVLLLYSDRIGSAGGCFCLGCIRLGSA